MLAHEDIWGAIDSLAARNGLSPSGLARRAGLDPTTFNKSKRYAPDGRPRWPSTESIAKVLRATSSTIGEFFGNGTPACAAGNGAAPQVAMREIARVPLVGEAHAGFEVNGVAGRGPVQPPMPARIINFPDTRYEPLYALSVVGDSMQPLYRDGDILFVAPDVPAAKGDRVVVRLKSGDVVVRILRNAADDRYAFHAPNPDHPDASIAAEDVDWMARVVYASQ